jgi:hypothetical protein
VRDEVVRIGTSEHEHADIGVSLGALDEGNEIADQTRTQKIHGRGSDLCEDDASFPARLQRLEFQ